MYGVLPLYKPQRLVEIYPAARVVYGQPLSYDTGIHLGLPYTHLELGPDEGLYLLYLGEVFLGDKFYFARLVIGTRGIQYRVFLVGVGYLGKELPPRSCQIYGMYLLGSEIRVAAFERNAVYSPVPHR